MNSGTLLLGLTLLSALGTIILYGLFFLHKEKPLRYYAQVLALSTFLFNSLAILLLTYYFLSSNLNFQYVWEYSAQDSPWYLKLSGVWAGQEGSLLLWVWLLSLFSALAIYLHADQTHIDRESRMLVQVGLQGTPRRSGIRSGLSFRMAVV